MVHTIPRLLAACLCTALAGCAGAIVPTSTPVGTGLQTRPDLQTRTHLERPTPEREALLVLPGFGYDRQAERAIRSVAPAIAEAGMDLYVPTYVSRGGLDDARARLRRFIGEQRLTRYGRVHVFAFIAGAWTFNPLDVPGLRLATVVFDRSPFQERAPRIASERLPLLTWLRYGRAVSDVARAPYVPLRAEGVRVGLLIETRPTRFIRHFAARADGYGPYRFECDAFAQPYDDCAYVPLDHGDVYDRFGEVWPQVLAFARTGRFTESADRVMPAVVTARAEVRR